MFWLVPENLASKKPSGETDMRSPEVRFSTMDRSCGDCNRSGSADPRYSSNRTFRFRFGSLVSSYGIWLDFHSPIVWWQNSGAHHTMTATITPPKAHTISRANTYVVRTVILAPC
jgi:hypothetical protein